MSAGRDSLVRIHLDLARDILRAHERAAAEDELRRKDEILARGALARKHQSSITELQSSHAAGKERIAADLSRQREELDRIAKKLRGAIHQRKDELEDLWRQGRASLGAVETSVPKASERFESRLRSVDQLEKDLGAATAELSSVVDSARRYQSRRKGLVAVSVAAVPFAIIVFHLLFQFYVGSRDAGRTKVRSNLAQAAAGMIDIEEAKAICKSDAACLKAWGFVFSEGTWQAMPRTTQAAATPTVTTTVVPTRPRRTGAAAGATAGQGAAARALRSVTIVTDPTGALVTVDRGAVVGRSPLTARLTPGAHGIRITKEGYDTVVDMIDVSGSGTVFRFRLGQSAR